MEKIESNKNIVYLSIGSNLGEKQSNLQQTIDLLNQKAGKILNVSSIYENPPLDFEASELFYNICLELETHLSVFDLLSTTQEIEKIVGRIKKTKKEYESRIIDIDILYYNETIINDQRINIPHLKLYERNFVLVPMSEIANGFIDPFKKSSIKDLLKNSKDTSVLVKTIKRLKL